MSDEPRDVIEILEHDHREVEAMFAELESLRGDTSETGLQRRKDLVDDVTIELVKHSVAEEVLVYPPYEKKVNSEDAEHARKEHAEAEETMARLDKLDPEDPGFDDAVAELIREIRHHIEDEEGDMFTKMRDQFSKEELLNMGTRVQAFKKVAPTRPHPNVPNEALPRLVVGPVASLTDRLRDLASGRGS